MSYLVLARKFRPQTFASVCGQEHVTRTLMNSITLDRVAHAYLFSGPRGVGKTSVARILSKALNCVNGPTTSPCAECTNCREIAVGTNLAVREIDGASHNSVDNVRELIESFRALPAPGSRYKVYIIDEVHMLSVAAFNALLKSLEEPPPHTVFILATTEIHKIPDTVISRCQRHEFRALNQKDVVSRLKFIVEEERMDIEQEALSMLARLSDGSMRDAQTLLDRVRSFCEGKITAREVGKVLGTVEREVLRQIGAAIFARDPKQALALVDNIFSSGVDPATFLKEFVAYVRDLMLAKYTSRGAATSDGVSTDLHAEEMAELHSVVKDIDPQDIVDVVQVVREGADSALRSAYPRYALEALVVRLATREPVKTLATIVKDLIRESNREEKSRGGTSSGGGSGISSKTVVPKGTLKSEPVRAVSPEPGYDPVLGEPLSGPVINRGKGLAVPVLNWRDFVSKVSANKGAKIFTEHLKRLVVEKLIAGELEARAPEFTCAYFNDSAHKRKLEEALVEHSGEKKWKIRIERGATGTERVGVSIQEEEQAARKKTDRERKNDIASHPKIKSLKELFPGSTIETIRIMDKEDTNDERV